MAKMFNVLALALLVACVVGVWIAVRRYSARKRVEEERAAAFMAEAAKVARKARTPPGKA
ncbi:MAG TPA: hypothetical protein VGP71_02285 [Burkholderiales bacterium]|jgi:hypothetical protein|nr:hypothetical protein [Burkholderiales bacterium]